MVEHGRGVRPADAGHGGQGGDRATLDDSADRAGSGWNTVGAAVGVVVVVVMSSSILISTGRFHGGPSVIVCRSSTTVAASVGAWHHGVVVPDALTVPAVADALRHITVTGVFYCPSYLREPWGGTLPPMPGCVWFHAVMSGHCELVVGGDRRALQAGDLALVPHGAGHRIEAGGPTEYPSIPDLPHEEQSDNYAVLRYGDDGPLTSWSAAGCGWSTPAPAICWTGSRPWSTSAPCAAQCSAQRSICWPRRSQAMKWGARR